MTRPRSALISLADTPWYHVVNRCVLGKEWGQVLQYSIST